MHPFNKGRRIEKGDSSPALLNGTPAGKKTSHNAAGPGEGSKPPLESRKNEARTNVDSACVNTVSPIPNDPAANAELPSIDGVIAPKDCETLTIQSVSPLHLPSRTAYPILCHCQRMAVRQNSARARSVSWADGIIDNEWTSLAKQKERRRARLVALHQPLPHVKARRSVFAETSWALMPIPICFRVLPAASLKKRP
jgi:hypothetical protein